MATYFHTFALRGFATAAVYMLLEEGGGSGAPLPRRVGAAEEEEEDEDGSSSTDKAIFTTCFKADKWEVALCHLVCSLSSLPPLTVVVSAACGSPSLYCDYYLPLSGWSGRFAPLLHLYWCCGYCCCSHCVRFLGRNRRSHPR